ncbi:MAG: HD domain-containing protein [Rhodobacter sp.]|nr:HD domain-containing protein [Rhodobacter sp.]
MTKTQHEIRDPIHVFIRLGGDERQVVDSRPFQRLRHIHQLALTHFVYPGATHRRFEHSLGVMELASRAFDVITRPEHVSDAIRNHIKEIPDQTKLSYWRTVLRMAALCHDVGHLPFSHAAERELLPEGWNHERMTRAIIQSDEMREIWKGLTPPLRARDIVKLALGKKEARDLDFTNWEAILSEIITGDAFGVDRMDYLLRDSHHAGVAYGRFDHYRLLDTLRILPSPQEGDGSEPGEPMLGVSEGGLHSAEALMLARYFMYAQVYFHPVRRIYDIHLMDFLREWLPNGRFSTDLDDHLALTDNEVMAALLKEAATCPHASRIVGRQHFKVLYERNPQDTEINPEAAARVYEALSGRFGEDLFKRDTYPQPVGQPDFPVELRDGTIVSSLSKSAAIKQVPVVSIDTVFAERCIHEAARKWLQDHRETIICPNKEET